MKKKGFTLIELLAAILVLSIVLGLTLYFSISSINKAKEKTYQTTINNIERESLNYLIENSDRLFYVSNDFNSNIEYQCITIQNLIDMGYFNNNIIGTNVSKNKQIDSNDYIYIERNSNTKSIINTKYLIDGNEACESAVTAISDIKYTINPSDDTWSKSKTINVIYSLKNISNVDDLKKYTYHLDGDSDTTSTNKSIEVNNNGTYNANIMYEDRSIQNKTIKISKIDNINPIISNIQLSFSDKINVNITAKDNESGIKKYGYLIQNNNNCPEDGYEYLDSNKTSFSVNDNGLYYICVKVTDNAGNTTIKYNSINVLLKIGYKMISMNYECKNIKVGNDPIFIYTGNCSVHDDGNDNWRVKFLTSGNLKLKYNLQIDAFLVGGGGGGGGTEYNGLPGSGGGGGYTATVRNIDISNTKNYSITIGAGGAGGDVFENHWGKKGGTTTAFGISAEGGNPGCGKQGGGNCSGGTGGNNGGKACASASCAGNGQSCAIATREFGEIAGACYAGGGGGAEDGKGGAGGGGTAAFANKGSTTGQANTGGGGSGGSWHAGIKPGKAGGSGVVVIRNKR